MIFAGTTEHAVRYFTGSITQIIRDPSTNTNLSVAESYYILEPFKNAADLIIEISGGQVLPWRSQQISSAPMSAKDLELRYYQSEYFTSVLKGREGKQFGELNADSEEIGRSSESTFSTNIFGWPKRIPLHATGKLTQFSMLMHRSWTAMIRDVDEIRAQLVKSLSVGLLVGVVFWNQAKDPEPLYTSGLLNSTVSNITSILFFGMMYTLISNMQSIPFLCGQNKLYRREVISIMMIIIMIAAAVVLLLLLLLLLFLLLLLTIIVNQ